jgi:hypothetical protein
VVPHLLLPQVEDILTTNSEHNGLDVDIIILWSLQGPHFTTCDNSLWTSVKAKNSQVHPTTVEDPKRLFPDCFNDLQPLTCTMTRRTRGKKNFEWM